MEILLHSYGFYSIIDTSDKFVIGFAWRYGPIEIQLIPEEFSRGTGQGLGNKLSWKKNLRGRVTSWNVTFHEWGLKSASLVGVDRATILSKNLDKFCKIVSQMDWAGLALSLENNEL